MMGLTACDSRNLLSDESRSNTNDNAIQAYQTSANNTGPSEFTIEAESYDNNVDLEAENPNTGAEIIFNASSSNTNYVTGTLQISSPYVGPACYRRLFLCSSHLQLFGYKIFDKT